MIINTSQTDVIISDLKWKFLVHAINFNKNIMIVGPEGCGKTSTAYAAAKTLNRNLFRINLGSTQDPRSTLIGNTHYDKNRGTYFTESEFIKGIQTPNAIILLDEISRAHPEAQNILMPVLDGQRYIRIDEAPDSPEIHVADNVSFIGTANIGVEFTATRVIDRAFSDRFLYLEMDLLGKDEQLMLLKKNHPSIKSEQAEVLADIYISILKESRLDSNRISKYLSNRMTLEAGSLLTNNFTLDEVAELCIFPLYSHDGTANSERTYVKQIVQRYLTDPLPDTTLF